MLFFRKVINLLALGSAEESPWVDKLTEENLGGFLADFDEAWGIESICSSLFVNLTNIRLQSS